MASRTPNPRRRLRFRQTHLLTATFQTADGFTDETTPSPPRIGWQLAQPVEPRAGRGRLP